MLKIYGKRQSRTSRCLWLLEEMSLPYTQIPIDTQNGDTRTPDYLALNPAGKVPVIDDDGFVLRESLAINGYLVNKADTPLWPADAQTRATIDQWSLWGAIEMESPLNALFRERRRGGDVVSPLFLEENLTTAGKTLKLLEDHLKVNHHVAGDTFTLGDINAYTSAMLAPMFVDVSSFPAVQDWMARCGDRAAWKRVSALP